MILLLDNYDSFTYNIIQLLHSIGMHDIDVVKNDKIDFSKLHKYTHIILSPGPATPSESGSMMQLIEKTYLQLPILGICLGHQAIAFFFGAHLYRLETPFHGKKVEVSILDKKKIFCKINTPTIEVGLYHSWAVSKEHFPHTLEINAVSNDGIIMGTAHKKLNIFGVQFHPESYMSQYGEEIMQAFLDIKH